VVAREFEHRPDVFPALVVGEENLVRPVPIPDYILARLVHRAVLGSEVALRVDDEALSARQRLLEEGVSASERHAVVAAFDDEINVGEHGDHFGEAGGVMAQEVGAGEVEVRREDGAGDEGGGHGG